MLNKKLENGFMYIVFGDPFNKEAKLSVESLLKFNPEVNVAIFTDNVDIFKKFNTNNVLLYEIKPKHIRAKVDYISKSPFSNTIYLDSDTLIVDNIEEIFINFKRDDVLVTQCFERKREKYSSIKEYSSIPYSFSEVNGGFLGFNDSPASKRFLKIWKKKFYKYRKMTSGWDQISLRIALWKSEVKICNLPYEYNIRSIENRLKLLNNKKKLGNKHLEPRIFHMHYSSDIHKGIYNIDTIEELEKIMRNKAYLI